ncbi:MAG: hypothetical protein ACK5MK_12545 [Dysgonomonas sp.]
MGNSIISFKELQNSIAKSYFAEVQKVYGVNNLTAVASSKGIVITGNETVSVMQSVGEQKREPKNMRDAVQEWIVENGVAYEKIPYVRKESEKWKPRFTPEERGLMSLSGKIARKLVNEGATLAIARQQAKDMEQLQAKIVQVIEAHTPEIIINNTKIKE